MVSVVYPIIASCRAFEDYTRVLNSVASSTYKIGGISVPFNVIYSTATGKQQVNAVDENTLQIHLISIQKWFIYWIVLACVRLVEGCFGVLTSIVPGYSLLRLGFSLWLISPMVSFNNEDAVANTNSSFDQTLEWKNFTQGGCGLVFFAYFKPWLEKNIDVVRKLSVNPLTAVQYLPLNVLANLNNGFKLFGNGSREQRGAGAEGENSDTSGYGGSMADYTNVLDSSFVMVMNIKNRFTGNGEATPLASATTSATAPATAPATTPATATGSGVGSKDAGSILQKSSSIEEFDVISGVDSELGERSDAAAGTTTAEASIADTTATPRKRGYFW